MSNFKPVTNFWFWCQKVLPLVYDDSISYYEVLCKISEYLNQVIDNVNALPDIIDEAVKEYIESGEIQKVLNEMLQNFNPINVKNPPAELTPAKGDGETDDTSALQAMIDYGAEHGLPMIFPAGVYRVSSLNIPESAYFWGVGNSTIFKAPNSENALINVTGDFTAFNMNFNGNIAGNITPADVITGMCRNVSFSQCDFTGCVSCVDVNISGILEVTKCHFSNYTDYAVHAEGTGRLMIDGMEVDSIANSGAMRFVRIDTSNSVVNNLTSFASVPIGVEITGDFNDVKARIPNCENPVNDGGQNNSYNIIGQSVQKKVTGKITYAANESEETVGTTKTLKANDIILQPTNPLTYKAPEKLDNHFNYVQFKDYSGNNYNVLVEGENLSFTQPGNVSNFGAKGDGITDDSDAINAALASGIPDIYFDENKTYLVTKPLLITHDNTHIHGYKSSVVKLKDNSYETAWSIFVSERADRAHISFDGFTIDGNRNNNIDYGTNQNGNYVGDRSNPGALITLTQVTDAQITNMTLKNTWGGGIWINDCNSFIIDSCKIYDYRLHGIAIRNNLDIPGGTFRGTISNNIIDGGVVGIENIFGVAELTIIGNVVYNNNDKNKFPSFAFNGVYPNIYPKGDNWNSPYDPGYKSAALEGDGAGIESTGRYTSTAASANAFISITGNVCNANEVGIRCEEESRILTVAGNVCASNNSHGIFVFSANFVTIDSNICSGNKTGIQLEQLTGHLNPSNCIVSNNIVNENSQNGIGLAGTRYLTITGNVIGNNNANKGDFAAIAMLTDNGQSIISSNEFVNYNGNDINGIKNYQTATGMLVSGNMFVNVTNPCNLDLLSNWVINNSGFLTSNFGQTHISTGSTSVVVTHGLAYAPLNGELFITPCTQFDGNFWVSDINTTTFTINVSTAATTDLCFNWFATKTVK